MATHEAILAIKVIADSTQAAAGLDNASKSASRLQRGVSQMTGPAIAAGVAVFAIGKKALDAASALQQSEGAVEAVFGKSANAVKAYAQEADSSLGLSASSYNQYAALVGTALQNAGFSVRDSVEASNEVMKRGADLSALYGGTTAEAVEAINAAVSRSEFDPLEKYGVSLNMTAVNAELAAKGQDKLTGAALDTAKKAVILEQVYEKSAKAAGQFAREQDSAAGSAQIASAQWENASAALGEALLPAASAVAEQLARLAGWMEKHRTVTMILIGLVAAFAAGILVLNVALKAYTLATMIAGSTAAKAWLKVLGPIGLVIAAVIGIVLVVRHLWRTSETFRSVVLKVWGAIKSVAVATGRAVKAAWLAVLRAIQSASRGFMAAVRAVWNGIKASASAVAAAVRAIWARVWSALSSAVRAVVGVARSAFNTIRSAVSSVVGKVQDLIGRIRAITVPGAIKSAIDAIDNAIDRVIDSVQSLIGWIRDIPIPKIDWPSPPSWLPGVKSAPAPAVRTGVAPRVTGYGAPVVTSSTSAGRGGFVQINVTGALDPEGVARQIRRVLGAHDRRMGGMVR